MTIAAVVLALAMVVPCDPASYPYNPTPVAICDPVDRSAGEWSLYYREKGAAEWIPFGGELCWWLPFDQSGWRIDRKYRTEPECLLSSLYVEWCELGCSIDGLGTPLQRHGDLVSGTMYEFAATVTNIGNFESGLSNVVDVCWPPTCNPAVDPAGCADPGGAP